jgi:hypothetical protein
MDRIDAMWDDTTLDTVIPEEDQIWNWNGERELNPWAGE